VVYDVSTGTVLAAATAPSFDPNGLTLERMQKYVSESPSTQVLTNKALSREALFFPGSTFKILTAAAGIDEGITGSASCRNGRNANPVTWEWNGQTRRRNPGRIADYSRGSHGDLSLSRGLDTAMAFSCNVFFGTLAAELGPERFHRAMRNAELRWVPEEKELFEYLPYAGFGQIVVKASPLEMAMLAGAAGSAYNEGSDSYSARPNWVQAVLQKGRPREPDNEAAGAPDRRSYKPFNAQVAHELRRMMVGVVETPGATAYEAFHRGGEKRLPGITVGGKTGTAEFEKKGGKTGRHAWFVGFARSDHEIQPRTLAFAVLVEDVRRGGTGGQVCAPVARDLIEQILPLPGREAPGIFGTLERFYQQQVRPRFGPFAPLVDWLRGLFNRR
jgi:penicillin-binding protein A